MKSEGLVEHLHGAVVAVPNHHCPHQTVEQSPLHPAPELARPLLLQHRPHHPPTLVAVAPLRGQLGEAEVEGVGQHRGHNCREVGEVEAVALVLGHPGLEVAQQPDVEVDEAPPVQQVAGKSKQIGPRQCPPHQAQVHFVVAHLGADLAHVEEAAEGGLGQHCSHEALLEQGHEAQVAHHDGQVPLDEAPVGGLVVDLVGHEEGGVVGPALGHLAHLDGVDWVGEDVQDSREGAGGGDLVEDGGLLGGLGDGLPGVVAVVPTHDVRLLEHVHVGRVILSHCQITSNQDLIYPPMQARPSLKVCVTGAAGQIAYSLLPLIASGQCFPHTPVELSLLDIEPALPALQGVVMELNDCAFPLLAKISTGSDPKEQFKDCDVVVFVGGFPRKPGMERKDLLEMNKKIFVEQGSALAQAKADVKCLVVANPCNTNALILAEHSGLPKASISCLSRLDHNRALHQVAQKAQCPVSQVSGVYILGNHSLTQYPCIHSVRANGQPIDDHDWLKEHYIPDVQKRGGAVLKAVGKSSAFSAAKAISDHLRDWYAGSESLVSMGVHSSGQYGVPEGLWSSFPVKCKGDWAWEVAEVPMGEFCTGKIAESVQELQQEREMVKN